MLIYMMIYATPFFIGLALFGAILLRRAGSPPSAPGFTWSAEELRTLRVRYSAAGVAMLALGASLTAWTIVSLPLPQPPPLGTWEDWEALSTSQLFEKTVVGTEDERRTALDLLIERAEDGQLSAAETTRLIDRDLDRLAVTKNRNEVSECSYRLARIFQTGHFIADRERRYSESCVEFRICVRPIIARGFDGPLITQTDREWFQGLFARAVDVRWTLDGRPWTPHLPALGGLCDPSWSVDFDPLPVPADVAGQHEITAVAAIVVSDDFDFTDPLHKFEAAATARYEVLADEPPDLIRFVRTPESDELASESYQVRASAFELDVGQWWSLVDYHEPSFPLPLAFAVYLETNGRRIAGPAECLYWPNESGSIGLAADATTPGELPEVADIVAIPSRSVLLSTTDLYEAWGGGLRFRDVPIGEMLRQSGLEDPTVYPVHPEIFDVAPEE